MSKICKICGTNNENDISCECYSSSLVLDKRSHCLVEEMFCLRLDNDPNLYMYEQLRPFNSSPEDRVYIVRSIFDNGQRAKEISEETFNELKPKVARNMIVTK